MFLWTTSPFSLSLSHSLTHTLSLSRCLSLCLCLSLSLSLSYLQTNISGSFPCFFFSSDSFTYLIYISSFLFFNNSLKFWPHFSIFHHSLFIRSFSILILPFFFLSFLSFFFFCFFFAKITKPVTCRERTKKSKLPLSIILPQWKDHPVPHHIPCRLHLPPPRPSLTPPLQSLTPTTTS